MGTNHFLQNMYSIWKQRLSETSAQVTIVSPYLTSMTADRIIKCVPPSRCKVFTRFRVEDFAQGSSWIGTLRGLVEDGYPLFKVDQLHAKVVLVHNEFATIGSQNLTNQGTRNYEVSTSITQADHLAKLTSELQQLEKNARPITLEMIEDVEEILSPIRRLFREASKVAREQDEILAVKWVRRRFTGLRDRIKKHHEQQKPQYIDALRKQMESFAPGGKVPLAIAQTFVAASAWWLTHLGYNAVRAPRHKKHIYASKDGEWKIDFGANTFLVSRAILECIRTTEWFLKEVEAGKPWSKNELIGDLRLDLSSSVESYHGGVYDEYPITDGQLVFGAQAIDVDDFTSLFLKHVPESLYRGE